MRFTDFLARYQAACARGDAEAILACVAEEYEGRYFYPAGNSRTFDRAALADGWRAAQESFAAAGARWAYENVAVAGREDERIVASWVAFMVEGQETGRSFLVSVFRQTPDGWKLVREHMEHRVQAMSSE